MTTSTRGARKEPNVLLRFWRDLVKKKLALIKVVYFLFVGASSSLFPYMTIHLRSLGITLTETAIIYAVLPLISWPCPPLAGLLLDRFGNIKLAFAICLVLSAVAANCLLLVPVSPLSSSSDPLNVTLSLNNDGGVISAAWQCDAPQLLNGTLIDCDVPCPELAHPSNVSFAVHGSFPSNVSGPTIDTWLESRCTPTNCTLYLPGGMMSSSCASSSSHLLTLVLYCIIRLLSNALIAVTNMFNESISLLLVKKHGGDYGYLRLWGSIGASVFAPITGVIIDRTSEVKGYTYYAAAFFVYGALKVLLACLVAFLPVNTTPTPAKIVRSHVRRLVVNSHAIAFLLVVFCSGMLWGLLENYLFIFLDEDLGASKSLMGLTVTVGNVAGMPFYVVSSSFINVLGHVNMIAVGLVCYAVRYIGYSFLKDPYWCLPFEALEAVTNGLMMVAIVTYAARVASPTVLSTMQGLWAALYYTLGKGVGGLVGGLLMDALGGRWMFRSTAVFSVVVALVYAVFHHVFLKKRPFMYDDVPGSESHREPF